MKTVEDHLRDVLAVVAPLAPIELRLLDAHGCMLAEDIVATAPLPGFDNSAMDGYAVRAADLATASEAAPVSLHVVGDIAAGSSPDMTIQSGLCARIMTGAPLPAGADAVVPVEWTDGGVAQVLVQQGPRPGECIRRAGEDVVVGDVLLSRGTVLGAAHIGLLAAGGRRSIPVHPRPRVVILSTGSELMEPGDELTPGKVVDSNGYALWAAAKEAGALPYRAGLVGDDPHEFMDTLEDHLIHADAVVTSGGVSVGAYDVVKDALTRVGGVAFDRVAMQPGMPQGFGQVGPDATPFFGLPGNPVSALVSFEVFVRPALRRMLGATQLLRPQVQATLTEALRSPVGKRQYVRAAVERGDKGWVARPTGGQGSHLLSGLAAANALVVVPEDVGELPAGAAVTAMLLERRGL